MIKLTFAAALIAGAISAPAFASETTCDDATMKKIDADITGMKDAAMKDKAMKDFTMAKAAMKKKNMADCETHLEGAMKNIM